QGGYSVLGQELVRDSIVGAISFGTLNGSNYNLTKVIESYTQFKTPTPQKCLDDFRISLQRSSNNAFTSFNLLLIQYLRARKMNHSLEEIINPTELATLRQQLHATVQFYAFMQLLGNHIYPNFTAILEAVSLSNNQLIKADITDAIYSLLTFEHLINKISELNIDMEAILANPTKKNLTRALRVMELPTQECTIKSGFAAQDKNIKLTKNQFFGLQPNECEQVMDSYSSIAYFGYLQRNISGYTINEALENWTRKKLSNHFFIEMGQESAKHLAVLKDRICLFEKLVATGPKKTSLTPEQKKILKKQFPVIFVTESNKVAPYLNELRSKKPLQLGEDIKMIATDSEQHRSDLKRYLFSQHIYSVHVVLISDLKIAAARQDADAMPVPLNFPSVNSILPILREEKHAPLFYKLYELFYELNDKRNKLSRHHPEAYEALNKVLNQSSKAMHECFATGKPVNSQSIHQFCTVTMNSIKAEKSVLERHRGILGIIDTLLTVLASLIIFYPVVCWYQHKKNQNFSFFSTDSNTKILNTLTILNEMDTQCATVPY
ncbi:MAG: hypothetical protein PSV35_00645, partial [bacterium]|nr:hypothetical protein [bacterium]